MDGVTYTGGEDIDGANVACVDASVATSTADSCTATGLTSGSEYYFAAFTKDTRGNYSYAVTPTGSPTSLLELTLADSTAGQVSNTFSFQNQTNTELFAFQLSTTTISLTVTDLAIALTGIDTFTTSNLQNLELYLDVDNDAEYDSGLDTLVSTGAVSVNGDSGTITFSTDFTVTGAVNYLIIGDTNAIANGAFVTFKLYPEDILVTGGEAIGTVESIQHSRSNQGGGGGSSAAIADFVVPGDGDVTGGTAGGGGAIDTNVGGGLIGTSPNFKRPSVNDGAWTTAANAYDNTDGTYATDNTGATNSFTNYGFSVPAGNTIGGMAVKLEVSGTTAAGTIDVQLSWDGGSTWTTAKTTPTLTTTDAVVTLGNSSDLWGRSWTPSEFSNANFAVRLTGNPTANTVQVDEMQVRVYHVTPITTGGGGGGGGTTLPF